MGERILIISNGHPVYSKGGAEAVAYRQFEEYQGRGDLEAMFLAAYPGGPIESGTRLSCRTDRELLFSVDTGDYFKHSQPYKKGIRWHFREVLEAFKPTVVHFHHFIHLGIEMIREVRNYDPSIPILLTLHEFIAICNQNGQMVKKDSHQLCYSESPADCNRCFPEISTGDFLLRKLYIQSFFELVDRFICPSHFLLNRYVDWGIPREKLMFVENGYLEALPGESDSRVDPVERKDQSANSGTRGRAGREASALKSSRRRSGTKLGLRFGFFGQINPFKGVDVLLEAVTRLSRADRRKLEITIHGGGLETWPIEFQEKVASLKERTKDCVRFHGKYEARDLEDLIEEVDWVVMPSVWWENSPVVIQEAYFYGRPLICSNIGGMKEKVRDGIDGLHFAAGNAGSLARVFESIIDGEYSPSDFQPNLEMPVSVGKQADVQLKLYHEIRASRTPEGRAE